MTYKLCNIATILVLLNFLLAIAFLGNADSMGLLRFLPFISYILNLFVALLAYTTGSYCHSNISRLLVAFVYYFLLVSLFIPNNNYSRIMSFLMSTYWITSYFIISYLTSFEKWKSSIQTNVEKSFYLLFIFVIYSMLTTRNNILQDDVLTGSNTVFYSLLFIPWIATFPSKKKWITMACIIVITIMSIKRSAIIILIGSLLLMIFDRNGGVKGRARRLVIVFCAFFAVATLYTPNSPIADVITRFENLKEDGGNGRIDIYEDVIDAFKVQPTINRIFGSGFLSVQNTLFSNYGYADYISAHNDFLEVLFDYGWIGFILYVSLHILLIRRCIILYKSRSELFTPYMISYYLFLVMSSVSHLIIYPSYFLILVAFWAHSDMTIGNRYNRISST